FVVELADSLAAATSTGSGSASASAPAAAGSRIGALAGAGPLPDGVDDATDRAEGTPDALAANADGARAAAAIGFRPPSTALMTSSTPPRPSEPPPRMLVNSLNTPVMALGVVGVGLALKNSFSMPLTMRVKMSAGTCA